MPQLYLAANYIANTDPDTWIGRRARWLTDVENAGHLQIVYEPSGGGSLQEMEVQAPTFVTLGAFQYPTFGRPHGGLDLGEDGGVQGGDNTAYISSTDAIEVADRYAQTVIPLEKCGVPPSCGPV